MPPTSLMPGGSTTRDMRPRPYPYPAGRNTIGVAVHRMPGSLVVGETGGSECRARDTVLENVSEIGVSG